MGTALGSKAELRSYFLKLSAAGSTGEAVFHTGELAGKVYFARGRVLWAIAAGQPESFQSILLRDNVFTRDALVAGIKQARAAGKRNLEEILVSLGVTDRELLASVIQRHTKSALASISEWMGVTADFVAREFARNAISFPLDAVLPPASAPDEHPVNPENRLPFEDSPLLADIPEVLDRLRSEIPFFLAGAVIDGETGMPVASVIEIDQLDIDAASAFCKQVATSCSHSLHSLGQAAQQLEEVTMTTVDNYILVRALNGGAFFLYLLIDGRGNVGMARLVAKRYLPLLAGFLS